MPIKPKTAYNPKYSALDEAKSQYKSWGLSSKNKSKILNITKSNIKETWSREAWLEATKKQLSWLTVGGGVGSISGTSGVKPTTDFKFTRETSWGSQRSQRATDYLNKEYISWKIDKEWKKIGGIKEKPPIKAIKVWSEDKKTIDTKKDIWAWDVDFTWKDEVQDDLGVKINDLTNKLNEEWMTNDEIQEIERQIKYYEGQKEDMDYKESQRDIQKKYDATTGEILEIQSSARLRRGQTSLKNLKKNIAYLWNMGQPAQSMSKLDAIDGQIEEAQTTYDELVKTEALMKGARALWEESKAAAFEKQMDDLQEDLDDNVSSVLQDALSKIDNAEINGLLYDEDAMEDFRMKLLSDTDRTVAELSDRNFKRRAFLLNQYKTIAEESKIKEANKNTVNRDMSAAQGYYVDGNWEPIISATTWKRINIPESAPMDPIFDKATGRLITFSTGENGEIVPTINEVYDEATFAEKTITSYADLVNKWTIKLTDVPAEMQNSVAEQLSTLEPPLTTDTPKVETIIWADWEKYSAIWDEASQSYKPIWDIAPVSDVKTAKGINWIIDYSTKLRGRTNLQCGELVNDYWTQSTWWRAWMWDTLESKLSALNKVWASEIPVIWGLMVSNPLWNEVWHTWIVQAINEDWSVDILEANVEWLAEWQAPVIRTYSAEDIGKMKFSKSPTEEEVKTKDFDKASVPQFVNYLQKWKIWTSATEVKLINDEFWSIAEFKRQAELYNNSEWWPRQKELSRINKIRDQVTWLLSDDNSEALSNSVWTTQWTIWLTPQRRKKEAYLADIQNFLDWKTLQQLIDVKAEWATFGSLSNEELRMLQNSASKLNQIAIRDDDDDVNRITWFKGSEKNFKAVIQETINEYNRIIKLKEESIWKETTVWATWWRIKWQTTGGRIK